MQLNLVQDQDSWGKGQGPHSKHTAGYAQPHKGSQVKMFKKTRSRVTVDHCEGDRLCLLFDHDGAKLPENYTRTNGDEKHWASIEELERNRRGNYIRMHTLLMYTIPFHLFPRALTYARRNPLIPPSLPVPPLLLQTTR